MINLLPYIEKKRIRGLYRLRLAVAALTFLSISGAVLVILFAPSYILSNTKETFAQKQFDAHQGNETAAIDADMSQSIDDINKKLQIFTGLGKPFLVSDSVIAPILRQKSQAIRIRQVAYTKSSDGKTPEVTLSGTADSREALLSFVDRLKTEQAFSKINLPVSNFVKGSDIDFSLQITLLAQPK